MFSIDKSVNVVFNTKIQKEWANERSAFGYWKMYVTRAFFLSTGEKRDCIRRGYLAREIISLRGRALLEQRSGDSSERRKPWRAADTSLSVAFVRPQYVPVAK